MPFRLQIVAPESSCSRDVLRLRSFVAADEQHDDRVAVLAEVNPVARTEHHPSFPDALADVFVVAKIAELKALHSQLNPGPDCLCQRANPFEKRPFTVGGDVLSNGQGHPRLVINISYVITIVRG